MMFSANVQLLLPIGLPLAGALAISICRKRPNLREAMTLGTALLLIAVVWPMVPHVLAGARPEFSFLELFPAVPVAFRLEPLGMLFALVASGLWLFASIYSIGYMRGNKEAHQSRFYVCFAVAIASTMGIALADNLVTLFIFYELLTLSTYPLVTHKGNREARQGGRLYLGILLSTSVGFLMTACIWVWQLTGATDFAADASSNGILKGYASNQQLFWLSLLFAYGIGKAALMPMHRWLPAAMVAPTPVSALLHAVAVVKAGVFTITKVFVLILGLDLLAEAEAVQWLVYVAGYTVLASSIIALRADNLKRRLAYSTISQLSYIVMAVAVLAPWSVRGASLHILAHACGKITLFFAAGAIYTATHKTLVSQLNGIGWRMPVTMTAFAIAALSMIGLPPTVGFISKWYMLMGALSAEQWFVIAVLALSTLLNAGYFLPIIWRAFILPETDTAAAASTAERKMSLRGEAPWPSVLALAATASLVIALFFSHQTALELVDAFIPQPSLPVLGLSGDLP